MKVYIPAEINIGDIIVKRPVNITVYPKHVAAPYRSTNKCTSGVKRNPHEKELKMRPFSGGVQSYSAGWKSALKIKHFRIVIPHKLTDNKIDCASTHFNVSYIINNDSFV